MDFTQKRKSQMGVKSLGDMRREGRIKSTTDSSRLVNGPKFFDCLERPWMRGDMMGVLSPTGVGKTSWCLFTIAETLRNNAEGICIIWAGEQDVSELDEKWEASTEQEPELADRLYIITNFDEEGTSRNMSITDIKHEVNRIRSTLNCEVIMFIIDHLHLLNNNGSTDFNQVCVDIKRMAKEINAYGIVVSQTTKANQVIDVPVPRTGSHSCSQFEWIMTNIISLFQPLKRVEHDADLPLLGWQLSKIRYKGKKDKVKEMMNYLLYFDHDTQSLRELTRQEKADFQMYFEKVQELRQNEEKFKSFQFDLSEVIKGKEGQEVRIDRVVGGGKPPSLDDDL